MQTIDADTHVVETEQTWKYLDESEAKYRPVLLGPCSDEGSRRRFWLIDGKVFSHSVNVGKDVATASREMSDVDLRLKHMDELKVDVQVLYPSLFDRELTRRPEIERALCRSYNRWLSEIWKKGQGHLRWTAVLPLMSMNEALQEVEFAKENGACGIYMRGFIQNRLLSDPYFYPLYEEAERLDLPICIHASTGSFEWAELFEHETGFGRFKVPVLSAFHCLVSDGVPQRFPKLRFGFIEVRAQWVPYVLVELRRRFERRGKPFSSDLMREWRLYVACQTDDDLPYILKYAGEDNLVIGTDYGHNDTSSEIQALRTLSVNGEVHPAIIRKILYDNPRTFYSL
jgi:predicted TIM-barrel fold metal-dependent hydrolase